MMITISCAGIVKAHKIDLTFRYCSHKSPNGEAGVAGRNEMLNPIIADGRPCQERPAKLA